MKKIVFTTFVLKEKIMEGMHHGALHCETNGLDIFVIHLSPFQWKKRNIEAEILNQIIMNRMFLEENNFYV